MEVNGRLKLDGILFNVVGTVIFSLPSVLE